MKIEHVRTLRGPNRYLHRPVAVARITLGELADRESVDFPGFTDALLAALPGLAQHHCAAGRPGGFVARLRGGTYFGHVVEHAAIELSNLVGRPVNFGRTTYAGARGRYDVIMECPVDEPRDSGLPARFLATAADLVADLLAGRPGRHGTALPGLRAAHQAAQLGPSTAAIAAAARRRGIPVERHRDLSLIQLGHGVHRRRVWAALTDGTSGIGIDLAGDKELTRRLLAEAGVPVAAGGRARSEAEAQALFDRLGPPVVVKPARGRQGQQVHLDVTTPAALRAAYAGALGFGGDVVVEQQLAGRDYRVLVVDGAVAAAAERLAAHVVGDGRATVADLVDRANADPRRGAGHALPLTRIALDAAALALLAEAGLRPGDVPAAGRTVWLRRNANLSTGGSARDVTDDLHPEVAALCVRVAALVGLDIAGVDLRLPDATVPLPPDDEDRRPVGGVVEVNAAPGLRMHLEPTQGSPRDVGTAIVEMLFPAGRRAAGASPAGPGRIPTVAVTGTNGKTTVTRLTAHLLAGCGLRVGTATSDGVYVGGQLVQRADATGPRSARLVLADPTVEAAVLETARGGILRRGLGYDLADVGVLTNITGDHLGQDGLESVADIADVKALVAEQVRAGGTLVLNADDPRVREIARRPRVRAADKRILWCTVDPDNPLVRGHLSRGGRAYLLRDGHLVEATGAEAVPLLPVSALPGSFGGLATYAAANALAAVAAARALDVPAQVVTARLATFRAADNPGRGVLWYRDGVHILVDYAHNPAAIEAVTEPLHRLWGRERAIAAATLPGDRRDDLLAASARALAAGFSRVVLYEDHDLRGRAPGALPTLLSHEIAAFRADTRRVMAADPDEAVTAALAMADPGDVVLVMYEHVEEVQDVLRRTGATPVAQAPEPVGPAPRAMSAAPA
ncbi:cyanophycin synthetase [Pilimelia terevasa]|uniref:Cyanophycin synthetase n=1 Tax=Pilimelia terevasa TaxID=53372 RepID=A0A8J3BF86_9ACTN|nr:cyanophycin synthetase [Pilimelia terevasa]GGK17624.1 cyanophycin synthetase [Pilimelia terevasa]